jgi:uncharacterized protein
MQELQFSPDQILRLTQHRPWPLPQQSWDYDQKWLKPLFLNIAVKKEHLQGLVPSSLTLDAYQGQHYISIVPFQMRDLHPRYLPTFKPLSDFNQVNLRTYVVRDNKPGVYFLRIENGNSLASAVAKFISGLPFQKSKLEFTQLRRTSRPYENLTHLEVEIEEHLEPILQPTEEELWWSERYCLYQEDRQGRMRRFELHHLPWQLYKAKIKRFSNQYQLADWNLADSRLQAAYYSPGLRVLTYPGQRVEST